MKWIDVDRDGDRVRLVMKMERLDSRVAEEVRAELTTSLPREAVQVELDLSRVEFADSMGISVLMIVLKLLPKEAPRMRLCGCRPELRQVFDLVHLDYLCDIEGGRP
ncbi:MAG: STAS domain-containing protein [Verrucomicrobiia bacterium]